MKIAVVCANGKAGKLIVQEAMEEGSTSPLSCAGENRTVAKQVIKKDLFRSDGGRPQGFRRCDRRIRRVDAGDSAAAQHVA